MTKRILIGLAAMWALAGAQGDLVLQQQIVGRKSDSRATIRIKGDKVRLDLFVGQPRALSMIGDLEKGQTLLLLHHQKMYLQTAGPHPSTRRAAPRPKATGRSEKVDGYKAEIYTWSNPHGAQGKLWVAPKFPHFSEIRKDLATLDKSSVNRMDTGLPPDLSALPGMVVKSQLKAGGQTITVTLLSAREKPVAASAFEIPAGYRPMPHPKPLARKPAPTTPKK